MRIGINVPNDLLNRVKSLQPEVNVSQVCREALENHATGLQRVEDWISYDGEIDEEVSRLAEDYEQWGVEPDWTRLGWDDAREWLKGVTSERWTHFLREWEFLESRGGKPDSSRCHIYSNGAGVKNYSGRLLENQDWFNARYFYASLRGHGFKDYEESREAYEAAWLSYVREVRRQYLADIDAKRQAVSTERTKSWENRPAPELPPQLRG